MEPNVVDALAEISQTFRMTLFIAFLALNVGVLLGMVLAALLHMARDPGPPSAAVPNPNASSAGPVWGTHWKSNSVGEQARR